VHFGLLVSAAVVTSGLRVGCISAPAASRAKFCGRASIRVYSLRQIEDLVREIKQFPVLLILFLHHLPMLVGNDLPLGVGAVLADQNERRQEDRLQRHDHRQQPEGVMLDARADPHREPDYVHIDERPGAGEAGDRVGYPILRVTGTFLLVPNQCRVHWRRLPWWDQG